MMLKDFYRRVILKEKTAAKFLRENNLLDSPQEADPCHRSCSVPQEKRKRDRGGIQAFTYFVVLETGAKLHVLCGKEAHYSITRTSATNDTAV